MSEKYPRLETRKISELKPLATDMKTISKEAFFHLKAQVRALGILRPPTVAKCGTILDLQEIVLALKEAGETELQVWVVDLPIEKFDVAYMALNNHASEWVWKPVSERIVKLKEQGVNLALTGFQEYDTQPLLAADWSASALDPALMEQQERSLF